MTSVLAARAVRRSRVRCLAMIATVAPLVLAGRPAAAQSVALEADALAYALAGYSAAIRITHDNGFSYALGTGRYSLPAFLVQGQETYAAAGWKPTSEAIQVLRVGYRFFGPRKDGPAVDAILLNQLWRLTADHLEGDTHFKTLGVGVAGGYYFHIGPHFYVYPTASFTYDTVYSGDTSLQGLDYEVPALGISGSIHVGWEL